VAAVELRQIVVGDSPDCSRFLTPLGLLVCIRVHLWSIFLAYAEAHWQWLISRLIRAVIGQTGGEPMATGSNPVTG
jgi:hypothetical protein